MNRPVVRHAWVPLALLGVAAVAGYGIIAANDTSDQTQADSALLAGLGGAAVVAALFAWLVSRDAERPQRWPAWWVGVVAFTVAIPLGWAAGRSPRWPAVDPALAVVAIVGTAIAIGAVVLHWTPSHSVRRRVVLGPALWGMVGAPTIALVLELLGVAAIVAGGVIGLYIADPALVERVSDVGVEQIVQQSGRELMTTPTVIFGIVVVYAVIAPLAEEFAKLLATAIFRPRVSPTRFDLIACGAFAGLGFASVETLMYALAAGDQWPLLAALRAPVALVHVAAAMTAANGWPTAQTGYVGVARGYGLAVLIHGLWNGLTVSVLVLTATVENPDQLSPLVGALMLGIFGLMSALIFGCATGIIAMARRFGPTAGDGPPPAQLDPRQGQEPLTERSTAISSATLGSA